MYCNEKIAKKVDFRKFLDPIWNLALKRVSKFVIPEFRYTLLVPKITKCGELLYMLLTDSKLPSFCASVLLFGNRLDTLPLWRVFATIIQFVKWIVIFQKYIWHSLYVTPLKKEKFAMETICRGIKEHLKSKYNLV